MYLISEASSKRSKISCEKCTEIFDAQHELGKHMVVTHGEVVQPPVLPDRATDVPGYYLNAHHLLSAGLSTVDSNILFMRLEACQLLKKLQGCEDMKSLLIQGPPGCGKSSVVWLWAC